MTEFKNILSKVLALTIDIFLLGFQTFKQIVLPNRKRKGNLLSSIFLFFVGVVERLNSFEYGVFKMATVFRKKYIRKAIFIIGGVLFLLSLFEWAGDQKVTQQIPSGYSQQSSSGASNSISVVKCHQTIYSLAKKGARKPYSIYKSLVYNFPTYTQSPKKYILVRSIKV